MKRDRCRSCHAEIIWTVTRTGARMPVDADPVPDGNVELTEDGTTVYALVHRQPMLDGVDRHLSHFTTCPNADQHRKKDKRR